MAKEPSSVKPVAKKPPPGAPKRAEETAEVNGKTVRKDPPADSVTQSIANETVETAPPKKPAKSPPVKGKVVRQDTPPLDRTRPVGDATVGFELPRKPFDAEAAAEEFLLGDDEPEENRTQALMGQTIDTEAPSAAAEPGLQIEETPVENRTQASAGDTLDSIDTEMPKLVSDDAPVASMTQALPNEIIDTEMSKESAERPKAPAHQPAAAAGAAPVGAQKGSAMASMLGGKYKLLKKLGQGGMGAVYKAHDEKLDRVVAIKVLAKELSGKKAYVERFAREGRVMIKLDHPNVIRCYDIDEDKEKSLHFLAIEFVEGGSVEGWLKKLGKFSIGDGLHLILKTAAGLQHAHERTLIHRDVKPDNILLTKDGIVKVADLGLAKDTEEDVSLTKTGAGAGTPIYMAPEQARDVKHVDCRCDIYALGIMMYVFLTGQPPFQGNTLVELISAKEKGKYDTMRKHNDEVPGKLDLIVDKMIAKDVKNRYASCQEVIDAIEPLGLANETLSFFESENGQAAPAKTTGQKQAPTKAPVVLSPKTSVGGAGKGPAAKTSVPAGPAQQTGIQEEEDTEQGVWYWKFVTPNGKSVTKKLSLEQVRTLIKSGHLDATAEISKSEHSGFRAAASYPDFQAIFKSLKTATSANVKGAKYRNKFKEIEEEDLRRRKYGWISRMFKSFGSTIFGLLWIVLILALVGGGGYFAYKHFINP